MAGIMVLSLFIFEGNWPLRTETRIGSEIVTVSRLRWLGSDDVTTVRLSDVKAVSILRERNEGGWTWYVGLAKADGSETEIVRGWSEDVAISLTRSILNQSQSGIYMNVNVGDVVFTLVLI